MSSIKMNIENRSGVGSNKVNKIRANKEIPAVIYSKSNDAKNIKVKASEFERVYRQAGTTSIIELNLEGDSIKAIIKDIQKHPIKEEYLHVDFQELSMDEKIRMSIPINLINRDNIRLQPSVLAQSIDEVEIECYPGDIPTSADYDVIDLDFSTPVFIRDLDIAQNEDITIITDEDEVVCTLNEPTYDEDAEAELAEMDGEVDVEVPLVDGEDEEEEEE